MACVVCGAVFVVRCLSVFVDVSCLLIVGCWMFALVLFFVMYKLFSVFWYLLVALCS